jgi:hypothetical protein
MKVLIALSRALRVGLVLVAGLLGACPGDRDVSRPEGEDPASGSGRQGASSGKGVLACLRSLPETGGRELSIDWHDRAMRPILMHYREMVRGVVPAKVGENEVTRTLSNADAVLIGDDHRLPLSQRMAGEVLQLVMKCWEDSEACLLLEALAPVQEGGFERREWPSSESVADVAKYIRRGWPWPASGYEVALKGLGSRRPLILAGSPRLPALESMDGVEDLDRWPSVTMTEEELLTGSAFKEANEYAAARALEWFRANATAGGRKRLAALFGITHILSPDSGLRDSLSRVKRVVVVIPAVMELRAALVELAGDSALESWWLFGDGMLMGPPAARTLICDAAEDWGAHAEKRDAHWRAVKGKGR